MATVDSTLSYSLAPEIAASLRRPLVPYKDGMVPPGVIAACFKDGGFTPAQYPELGDAVRIDRLLELVEQHAEKCLKGGD